jgi:hypothetical protein
MEQVKELGSHQAAPGGSSVWKEDGHLFANEEQAVEVAEAVLNGAKAGDGGLKAAAVAEVSVKARIQPGALHGHTRAFAEGAAAATMTAIKEVGAVAIDSVAGAFGARPPPPGATRSALAVVARGEGKPDALVLFGSRFQKTPAGQPPELAIDARMKLAQGAPTAGDALVLGDRGYGVKMLSIADCSIWRPELANEHLFRFRPTHSPKGFMSKHEDFDVTVADDDAGKALCTYLMQHVGPAPSDAPPGSAEEAAAAPVEATDTNV